MPMSMTQNSILEEANILVSTFKFPKSNLIRLIKQKLLVLANFYLANCQWQFGASWMTGLELLSSSKTLTNTRHKHADIILLKTSKQNEYHKKGSVKKTKSAQ